MQGGIIPQFQALRFMLAGNCTVTIKSISGTRFTYKIVKAEKWDGYFISVLRGCDNISDYSYMGIVENMSFRFTENSKVGEDALSYKAFIYIFSILTRGLESRFIEIWHEGKCGKCGRKLTDPQSIEQGFGPHCISSF